MTIHAVAARRGDLAIAVLAHTEARSVDDVARDLSVHLAGLAPTAGG